MGWLGGDWWPLNVGMEVMNEMVWGRTEGGAIECSIGRNRLNSLG